MRKLALLLCLILAFSFVVTMTSCGDDDKVSVSNNDDDDDDDDDDEGGKKKPSKGTAAQTEQAEETEALDSGKIPGGDGELYQVMASREFDNYALSFDYPDGMTKHNYGDFVTFSDDVSMTIELTEEGANASEYADPAYLLAQIESLYSAAQDGVCAVLRNPQGIRVAYASVIDRTLEPAAYVSLMAFKVDGIYYTVFIETVDDDLTFAVAEMIFYSLDSDYYVEETEAVETEAPDLPETSIGTITPNFFEDDYVTFSYPFHWVIEDEGDYDDLPSFDIGEDDTYDGIWVKYTREYLVHPADMLQDYIDNYYYDDTVTDTVTDCEYNANGVMIYRMSMTVESEYSDPYRITVLQFAIADDERIACFEIVDNIPMSGVEDLIYDTITVKGEAAEISPVPQGYAWYDNGHLRFLRPLDWRESSISGMPAFIADDNSNLSIKRLTTSQVSVFYDLTGSQFYSLMSSTLAAQGMTLLQVNDEHGYTPSGVRVSIYELYATMNGAAVYEKMVFFQTDAYGWMLTYGGTQANDALMNQVIDSLEVL